MVAFSDMATVLLCKGLNERFKQHAVWPSDQTDSSDNIVEPGFQSIPLLLRELTNGPLGVVLKSTRCNARFHFKAGRFAKEKAEKFAVGIVSCRRVLYRRKDADGKTVFPAHGRLKIRVSFRWRKQ